MFLLSLKRFIARRGNSQIIFSDNGTNFWGANTSLRNIYHFLKVNINKIHEYLSGKEIKWKFIVPNSPRWGVLWEVGIKSTKFHLRCAVGNRILSFEQMTTVLSQVEAILNSRPLCPISTDPKDLTYLTPGHFLIGQALTPFPERDVQEIPDNRLKIHELCSKVVSSFGSVGR